MIHGKAKQMFFKFILEKHNYTRNEYNKLPLVCQQALIVSWLDSQKVFVSAPIFCDTLLGYNRGFSCEVYDEIKKKLYEIYNDNDVFNTRPEATQKAIEKSIEILNERL